MDKASVYGPPEILGGQVTEDSRFDPWFRHFAFSIFEAGGNLISVSQVKKGNLLWYPSAKGHQRWTHYSPLHSQHVKGVYPAVFHCACSIRSSTFYSMSSISFELKWGCAMNSRWHGR